MEMIPYFLFLAFLSWLLFKPKKRGYKDTLIKEHVFANDTMKIVVKRKYDDGSEEIIVKTIG